LIYYNLRINSGEIFQLSQDTKMRYCGSTKAIRRSFIGSTRCPEIRCQEDLHFYKELLAKNPTEKFTGIVAKHYDFPRTGSLTDRRINNMIKLSVCIPVYNQEKLIATAIASIPDRQDVEIVIVDDASTDKTVEVIKRTKRKVTLIRNKKNMGVGYSFNECIDQAQGEYIIRLDSDDHFLPGINDFLKELDGTDVVYHDIKVNSGKVIKMSDANKGIFVGITRAYRRDFVGDTRCPEIRVAEDMYFHLDIMAKNPTEKYSGIIVIAYNHPRDGSLCAEKEKQFKSAKVIVFYYPLIIRGGVEVALRNLLQRLFGSVNGQLIVVYENGRSDGAILKELSQFAKVVRGASQIDYADIVVECSIFHRSNIMAGKRIQWVHCVVDENVYAHPNHDCDEYVAVSKASAEGFPKAKVFLNDLDAFIQSKAKERIDWKFGGLKLVTVSRIATVKGFDRIPRFCEELEAQGVKYEWIVVGRGFDQGFESRVKETLAKHNVNFVGELSNPYPYMKEADYLVQLSDSESFGLSVMEAQVLGTPSVLTDYKASNELLKGFSVILRRDMSNLTEVVRKLKEESPPPTREYTGDASKWINLLNETNPDKGTVVKIIKRYHDIELNQVIMPKTKRRTTKKRAGELVKAGVAIIL